MGKRAMAPRLTRSMERLKAELGAEWARPGAENSGVLGRQSSQ